MRWDRRCLSYGVALGSTAIAFGLTLQLKSLLFPILSPLFYVAIIVSTGYGGFWPGLVAVVLSTLAIDYFFIAPQYLLLPTNLNDLLQLVIFSGVALLIHLLIGNWRDSQRKIERLNRQLLAESSKRLETALNAAQMGMWDWDRVTGEITWSPEHERLLGIAPGSFDGRYETFEARVYPEDLQELNQAVERSLQNRLPYQHEYRVVWLDGSIHWVEGRGQAFYDKAGQPIRMTGTIMAIDDRKQAELALQENEQKLQLFIKYAPASIVMFDTEMRYLAVSQRWLDEFRIDASESIIGRSHYDLFPHLDERFKQRHQLGLSGVSVPSQEDLFVFPDGSQQWFRWAIHPWYHIDNTLGGIILFSENITERKQAEITLQQLNIELEQRVTERTLELTQLNQRLLETLQEKDQTYKLLKEQAQLLDLAHDSIIAWNLDSTITFWNRGAEFMYGWTKAEALGQESHGLLKTQFSQPLAAIEAELLSNGYWEGELIHYNRDHHPITVSSRWVLQRNEVSEPIKVLEINNDITHRKQAEQALQQYVYEVEDLYNNAPCGYHSVNSEGILVRINDTELKWLGYSREEVLYKMRFLDLITPVSQTVYYKNFDRFKQQGWIENLEFQIISKNGSKRWINLNASAVKDESGNFLMSRSTLFDINDRKRIEAALQQQTQQEQLLWAITQAIRQSLDLNTIINTTVTEVRKLLEVDRVAVYQFSEDWSGDFIAESVDSCWVELVGPGIQKVWEDTYLQETQGGRFRNYELFVIPDIYNAGLQPCHIELLEQFQAKAYAVAPIFYSELPWGLLAIYQNTAPRQWQPWEMELLQQIASQMAIAIHQSELYRKLEIELQDRKQATAVLREAERRWRSLLDNVQLIVVGLDEAGIVNYVNPFYLTLTGYTRSEVIGKNWFANFLPLSIQQSLYSLFADELHHHAHPYYQNPILTKSGEERFVAWNNTVLQDSAGNTIGTISIGEDITERQKIEKIKNEFISVVSHELRTPLTSIRGSLGLLATGVMDNEPDSMKRMIEIASIETERLVRLVNDMLDLEKLETGKISLVREWCEVGDLMRRSLEVMESSAQEAGVQLELQPLSVQIWVAPDRIIQTLTNLLSNAIKFSPVGGTVTLSVAMELVPNSSPSSYLLFAVRDEGRGIPHDKLETIFGRFQQVDQSDSRDRGGTGLGLAICKSIVQQHGGRIWAESIFGQGSVFFFTLPLPTQSG